MNEAEKQHLPLSAAVLAGGMSRRMGRDKALLPLVEGGAPMLATVLQQLHSVADDVSIVANDGEGYQQFGHRIVPDVHAEIGALGGVHAAISHASHDHCLVVACDMPFLSPPLLQYMAGLRRDYDVLVPALPGESRQGHSGEVLQTLHSIYSKRCLPAIEARILEGKRQVMGFFSAVIVRKIGLAEITIRDPELRSFFNTNTPESLTIARAMARGEEPPGGDRRSSR